MLPASAASGALQIFRKPTVHQRSLKYRSNLSQLLLLRARSKMSLKYLRFPRIRYFGCSPRSRQICAVEMLPSPPIKAAMFPPPLTPLPTGQGTRHAGEKRETPKMPDFFPPEGRTCPAMSLLGDLRGALVDYDGLCRSRIGWRGALMGAWLKRLRDPCWRILHALCIGFRSV